jgi:hypothetical protein
MVLATGSVSILINTGPCYGVLNLSIVNQTLSTTDTFEACETITAGPAVTVTSTRNVIHFSGGQEGYPQERFLSRGRRNFVGHNRSYNRQITIAKFIAYYVGKSACLGSGDYC